MIFTGMMWGGSFPDKNGNDRHAFDRLPEPPSADLYATLVSEIVAEGLLVLTEDLRVEQVNLPFCQTFEVDQEDVQGRRFYDMMEGQWDLPPIRELVEETLSEERVVIGTALDHEFDRLGRRELLLSARRLEEYPFLLLAVEDRATSEERGVLYRERESLEEKLLERVLRDLPDIVMIHDVQAHANVWCNDHVEKVLGYSPEEVYNCGSALLPFLLHPADLERIYGFYVGYQRSDEGDPIRQITFRVLNKEGSYQWLATRESAFRRDNGGRVREVLIVARDITEQVRAEQDLRELTATLEQRVERRTSALKESEERFRALVKASAQILWTTEPSGAAEEVSPTWGAFTGQTYEQARGWGWLDAVHPADRDEVEEEWRRSVKRETPVDTEFRLYHAKSGQWRWTHCRAVPLRNEEGSVHGWVGMNADIDERKRAEQELLELNVTLQEQALQIRALASELTMAEQQERRRIAQILHDDLQQRLFGIQMKIPGIRRRIEAGDKEGLLGTVAEVEAWLSMSIAIARQLTVDLSPPVLEDEGLTDTLRWLVTQMRDVHGLKVRLEAEHAFRMEDKDMRVLLFQIVRELLFNAVKHSGVDRATVTLEEVGGQIVIRVIDEGRGFEPEEVMELSGRTGRYGLFSVRERIRLFGGDMEVTSAPDQGTRITVRVPVHLD